MLWYNRNNTNIKMKEVKSDIEKQYKKDILKLIKGMSKDNDRKCYIPDKPNINYLQVVKLRHKEKMAMYMELPKKELVKMLLACNDVLDGVINSMPKIHTEDHRYLCPKCGGETKPSIYAYTLAECIKCGYQITEFNQNK